MRYLDSNFNKLHNIGQVISNYINLPLMCLNAPKGPVIFFRDYPYQCLDNIKPILS